MSRFLKAILPAAALAAGLAVTAQAQSVPGPSVASLPPTDQGPRASSHNAVSGPATAAIAPSGNYPGVAPGAGTGIVPPHFEKPADWDQNAALHPYTSTGMGPKPH